MITTGNSGALRTQAQKLKIRGRLKIGGAFRTKKKPLPKAKKNAQTLGRLLQGNTQKKPGAGNY